MIQKNKYTKTAWEKKTLIKDMVHGYIEIPKPIMLEIIDSEQFQRLKDIEQTGMEALYPSATHKRFSHSLGVYHLACKAFVAFQNNVLISYPEIYGKIMHKYAKDSQQVWTRWGMLFRLAALLHDCGHSPFSHTLEFIYDLAQDGDNKVLDNKLKAGMNDCFCEDFSKGEGGHCGKAHERMSSLYIMTDDYNGLRTKVEDLLRSYVEAYDLGDVYSDQMIMNDDIEFMIRMIIGCLYDYDIRDRYAQVDFLYENCDNMAEKKDLALSAWSIELQLRNCIIGMLNSRLDVDNLDYVVRDSKFSGYANHVVDLDRLLDSFTIVRAFEVNDFEITRECNLDYCINLKEFTGTYLNGRLSGECHILCEKQDIKAHGRICIKAKDNEQTDVSNRVYQATDDFSANLEYNIDGTMSDIMTIKPPQDKDDIAYINFRGKMEGKLTGVVFANDDANNQDGSVWREKGKQRIYFAYEQKCMSVLMSAVYNSNFEKKWIYGHHISTFANNFLYIYLLEQYASHVVLKKQLELIQAFDEVLVQLNGNDSRNEISDLKITEDHDREKIELRNSLTPKERDKEIYGKLQKTGSDDLAVTNNIIRQIMRLCDALNGDNAAKYSDKFYGILVDCCRLDTEGPPVCLNEQSVKELEKIREEYKGIVTTEMQVLSDILAMYSPYYVDGLVFYKTSDRDLIAAYKNLYLKLANGEITNSDQYKEFKECYEELAHRRYLKCLWKSQPEFEYYFNDWTQEEMRDLKKMLRSTSAPREFDYVVLSDNIPCDQRSTFANDFWEELKNKYKFDRFVCVLQQIWTKRFVDYNTYMKRGERVLRLKDIKLFNDDTQKMDFFYFYYQQREPAEINVSEILQWLKNKIREGKDDYKR